MIIIVQVVLACPLISCIQATGLLFGAGTLPFGPDSQMCLNISINDDQLVEKAERLVICGAPVSTEPAVIVQNAGCTDVYVEDNDGN